MTDSDEIAIEQQESKRSVRVLGGWDANGGSKLGQALSASGSTLAVGAYGDTHAGTNSGAVHIYRRSGRAWSQEAKLVAGEPTADDWFGSAVSLAGNTLAVSALQGDAGLWSGAVYVFGRSGGEWTQEARIVAPDGAPRTFFGTAILLSGDTLFVGCPWDDEAAYEAGSVYWYERIDDDWILQGKLLAADRLPQAAFGMSLAKSEGTLVVGSPGADDQGFESGAAYVFTKTADGDWLQEAKLLAPDVGTQFARSVAAFGENLAVGTTFADTADQGGSVYLYSRDEGEWLLEQKLTAAHPWQQFGGSLALSGTTLLVGAPGDNHAGSFSGAAYSFALTSAGWREVKKLTAPDADWIDFFGGSLALSGNEAFVGAPNNAPDGGAPTGSVYVYHGVRGR